MGPATRFAPSPTGLLHRGHAFSALSAYQRAKELGGRFVLRIEDIDQTRCRPAYTEALLDDLAWLGLRWEEPVRIQSQHMADYHAALGRLRDGGLVYRCFKTRKEVADDIGRAPHGLGLAYRGAPLSAAEENARLEAGEPYAWRLSLDAAKALLGEAYDSLTFTDELRGTVTARPHLAGDVVLARKDLGVAYHLAVVVDDALQALTTGQADAVIVLENDLYRRADATQVDAALAAAQLVIVADHQQTATSAKAHLLLPVASFAEGDGTLVSFEGRAQRFFQVFEPSYYDATILIREGWRWLHALHSTLQGKPLDWTQLDAVTAAVAASNSLLARIGEAAPNATFRIKGLKLAREPHRYSGRTAMRANISVHEPRQPQDQDSAFAFSMEGYSGSKEDRQQIPFAWSPGWNSPQAWNKFQDEVGGHLRAGDPGVRLLEAKGVVLPWFSVPAAFNPAPGTLQAVALHHLFGSEETSAGAAPLQERIPAPYALLAKAEADRLGVNDGALLSLTVAGQTLRLPLQITEELAIGVVGLPVGLVGMPALIAGSVVTRIEEAAQ